MLRSHFDRSLIECQMSFIRSDRNVEAGSQIGDGCRSARTQLSVPGAVLGENCQVKEHVVIAGALDIGNNAVLEPYSYLTVTRTSVMCIHRSACLHRWAAGPSDRNPGGSRIGARRPSGQEYIGNHAVVQLARSSPGMCPQRPSWRATPLRSSGMWLP